MTQQQLTNLRKAKERNAMPKSEKLSKQPLTILDLQTHSNKKLEERKKVLEDHMTNQTVLIHHGDKYLISGVKVVKLSWLYKQLYFTGTLVSQYATVH